MQDVVKIKQLHELLKLDDLYNNHMRCKLYAAISLHRNDRISLSEQVLKRHVSDVYRVSLLSVFF